MDCEFIRTAYEAHHALFRHYSQQIFKTRVSIITIIILFFGYLLGFPPFKDPAGAPLEVALLAYLSATLISLLFSVETAYYRRLTQVVQAARRIEMQQKIELYFSALDPVSHWQLYGIYCCGIIAFSAGALVKLTSTSLWQQHWALDLILVVLLAIPPALAVLTVVKFRHIAGQGLGQGEETTTTETPAVGGNATRRASSPPEDA